MEKNPSQTTDKNTSSLSGELIPFKGTLVSKLFCLPSKKGSAVNICYLMFVTKRTETRDHFLSFHSVAFFRRDSKTY